MANRKHANLLPIHQYCTSLSDKVTCQMAASFPGACQKRWNQLFGSCTNPNGTDFNVMIKDTCKLSCGNSHCKWMVKIYIMFMYFSLIQ